MNSRVSSPNRCISRHIHFRARFNPPNSLITILHQGGWKVRIKSPEAAVQKVQADNGFAYVFRDVA